MVLLAMAVAIPMTFLSSAVIVLLFGADYYLAGAVLAVHIWAAVFVFLGVASEKWFIIENRQILSLQRTGAGAFVNIGLNLILIPAFGLLGAAWATVISQATAGLFYDVIQSQTRGMYHMKMKSLNLFGAIRRVSNAHR
jgi:O-antigen/teichoic acid export membrane protein